MSGDRILVASALTREAFAPFGEVLDVGGRDARPMNGDRAVRHHALAAAEASGPDARIILSIAVSKPVAHPVRVTMVERHPLGSQAFMPLGDGTLLVVVCPDECGEPGRPQAFVTAPGQGVSYRAGVWHGILAPIGERQGYLVVDRDGPAINLEERFFAEPWTVRMPPSDS
ncbi:ureidoglycolate lyase [Methylobacterium oryzae]|uniref:Ureidoglycolate hydrolase n=1 Tax=Methylobacterium oryzae TaxID=334852 RepID=A0ABU7TV46_9HYPH